jgi:hypothetical protein
MPIPGIKLEVTYRSLPEIEQSKENHLNDEDPKQLWFDYMDLWNATGAAGLPKHKVKEQREKFFQGIHFTNIRELIKKANNSEIVI